MLDANPYLIDCLAVWWAICELARRDRMGAVTSSPADF
jgi:hypothetical protein